MRSYRPLIQLAKQKLDEKKRKLADITRLRESYQAKIEEIDRDIEAERLAAAEAEDFTIGRAFPAFVDAARARQRKHAETVVQISRQEELARIEVQGAYQEVRKYELAEEKRLEREKAERDRREQIEMDEIAMNLHRLNARRDAETQDV